MIQLYFGGVENIYEVIIPIEKFRLNWKFTDEKYDRLPKIHLEQLKPLKKNKAELSQL